MTGLELPLLTIALLVAASFLAGWVDSIVGGGGLIQLPSLLIGLPAAVGLGDYLSDECTGKPGSSMGDYWQQTRLDG